MEKFMCPEKQKDHLAKVTIKTDACIHIGQSTKKVVDSDLQSIYHE